MMVRYCNRILLLLLLLAVAPSLWAQRLIQYESGMGSRDPNNSDVWILYQGVHAMHDGMHLYADSALLDMKRNDFTAFRNIRIEISDTTTLTGDHLVYNGNTKIINIRGKQVILVDGATILMTDKLTYDRNANLAFYDTWGHSSNNDINLESRIGRYDANVKEFYIYNDVVLFDTSARLETDTLLYNTINHTAYFVSPTHIYSDSATMYSEEGSYNTSTNYALSTKASHVWTHDHHQLTGDTLHYYHDSKHGLAYGHVWLFDSVNNVACMGGFGESNQEQHFSIVTDSAFVLQVDSHGDSLFLIADTIQVVNNEDRQLETVTAFRAVHMFRNDVQAICDSLFYRAADSMMALYHNPVVWYDTFQCSADTVFIYRDSSGLRLAQLRNNTFAFEQFDPQKFNQVKGRHCDVHFLKGEPTYADVMGSAEMLYYITEESPQHRKLLIGVNYGLGSDMRIYFENRQPNRVVTMGNPDMQTYPFELLPADKHRLKGFRLLVNERPQRSDYLFYDVAPSKVANNKK